MKQEEKVEIQRLLGDYVSRFPSQAKAAASLDSVSEATVISVSKGNWDKISEKMWLTIAKQVGYSYKGGWQLVQTKDYKTLTYFFEDARLFSNVFGITAPAGSGKTFIAEHYCAMNMNAFHIECAEYYNKRIFLGQILKKIGKDNTGYNVSEMMDEIIDSLRKMECPLIIIDEADKLSDSVLYFFITLYNMLKGKCGIVIMATEHLEKRITRGRRLNKKGYQEIYSRIGRKFIKLPGTDKKEVEQICMENGITDTASINEIFNEYEGDLRRLERGVHRHKRMIEKKNSEAA